MNEFKEFLRETNSSIEIEKKEQEDGEALLIDVIGKTCEKLGEVMKHQQYYQG